MIDSFEILCSGSGKKACRYASANNCSDMKLINPFCEIKAKELSYFCYLNNIKRNHFKGKPNDEKIAIANFLSEVETKNSLALFNISKMLKKLDENN